MNATTISDAAPNCRALQRAADRRLAVWLFASLGAAFLAMIARLGEVTHDAFHEMALFRAYWVGSDFPLTDLFAYTPTVSPSVHHEWGTGAILYLVSVKTGLGLWGFSVLKFCLIGGMWSMLYRVARMRGVHPYLFAIFSIAVFPTLWVGFATIRATLFTLLFLSIQLWMQEHDRRGKRWWLLGWWIMLVVWLNLHAGFVVGLGLLAIYGLERFYFIWRQKQSLFAAVKATWHLSLVLPMTVCSLPLNPYGWQYLPYLVRAISMKRPLITEWQPLWHTYEPELTLMMFGISVYLVFKTIRSQSQANLLGVLGLAICAVMALKHLRHGSIYSIVWIAYAPAWISHTRFGNDLVAMFKSHRMLTLRLAQTVAATSIVWCLVHSAWQTTVTGDAHRQSACYPIGAVRYLRQQEFTGNLLTPFHAGAFVSWELFPRVKVSLDGRYEVAYQPRVFDEHWRFFEGAEDWSKILDDYPHDAILCNQSAKVRPNLERFREPDSAWRFAFEDGAYVLLVRNSLKP